MTHDITVTYNLGPAGIHTVDSITVHDYDEAAVNRVLADLLEFYKRAFSQHFANSDLISRMHGITHHVFRDGVAAAPERLRDIERQFKQ